MSTVIIVYIILVVIPLLVFLLMGYTSTANKSISLLSTPSVIEAKDIANQHSVNYTYAMWINVASWSNNESKPIITFSKSSTATSPTFSIYLDPTDSNLYCSILTLTGVKKILITSTLPLQSWVQIVVSVENNNVDCYVNGKMTNATILSSPQQQVSSTSSPTITIGGSRSFNAAVQRVSRVPYTVDPYTVWSNYMADYLFVSSSQGPTYNVKVALLKDKQVSYETKIM